MSCYVMNDKDFSKIASYIATNDRTDEFCTYSFFRSNNLKKEESRANLNVLIEFLYNKNIESYKFRYSSHESVVSEDLGPLNLEYNLTVSDKEFVETLECLEYQSCELPDYFSNTMEHGLSEIHEMKLYVLKKLLKKVGE